jgi:hypothetical protein
MHLVIGDSHEGILEGKRRCTGQRMYGRPCLPDNVPLGQPNPGDDWAVVLYTRHVVEAPVAGPAGRSASGR